MAKNIIKNINGYGSVHLIGGTKKRRKPWAVRITQKWNDDGKQVRKYLGTYSTYNEAVTALENFNKNPFDICNAKTFVEIYEMFSEEKFDTISHSNVMGYKASFDYAKDLHEMRFGDIKASHLQKVINDCPRSAGTKKKIKVLFNQMYDYAIKNDLANKNYSQFIKVPKDKDKTSKEPFSYN